MGISGESTRLLALHHFTKWINFRHDRALARTKYLFLAVRLKVRFRRLLRVFSGVSYVGSRCVRVVRRRLMISRLVVLGCFRVMPRGMRKML